MFFFGIAGHIQNSRHVTTGLYGLLELFQNLMWEGGRGENLTPGRSTHRTKLNTGEMLAEVEKEYRRSCCMPCEVWNGGREE